MLQYLSTKDSLIIIIIIITIIISYYIVHFVKEIVYQHTVEKCAICVVLHFMQFVIFSSKII